MPLTTQQIDALKKITSPSVANAIETFKVRPREQGNLSSDIRALFPEMGPMVGYAVTALIRAEPGPDRGPSREHLRLVGLRPEHPRPARHRGPRPRRARAARAPSGARCRPTSTAPSAASAWSPTARCATSTRSARSSFQFCAAHVSVSHANVHMVDFGIPVKVGGVWIKPGDLVHGDQHGVVTIPARDRRPASPRPSPRSRPTREKIISVCQAPGFTAGQAEGALQADPPGDRTDRTAMLGRDRAAMRAARDPDGRRRGGAMIEIRLPRVADAAGCAELAALVIGEERAGAFIRSHMERHHLIVAEADGRDRGLPRVPHRLVPVHVRQPGRRARGLPAQGHRPRVLQVRRGGLAHAAALLLHRGDQRACRSGCTRRSASRRAATSTTCPRASRELLFYRRIPPRGSG